MAKSKPESPNIEDFKELRGLIERITYSDAESGYSVLRLRVPGYPELVTAVGILAAPVVGEELLMSGVWTSHPKFGEQFKIESCKTSAPQTTKGIEKYLGSGLIKGVGPSMAARIVERFGDASLDILDNEPERLWKSRASERRRRNKFTSPGRNRKKSAT